eukprot:scaffold79656_cov28-Attheya_sp.AAC.1
MVKHCRWQGQRRQVHPDRARSAIPPVASSRSRKKHVANFHPTLLREIENQSQYFRAPRLPTD